MFVFALIANVTYVARYIKASLFYHVLSSKLSLTYLFEYCSILVRTIEWDSIKANMSWLLDAAVCVALDLFVSFF